jgi:uncharacterized NAD(P)/FAD-binding protein YdhS
MGTSSVAIVGAGAAGVLTTLRLLDAAEERGQALEVVLIDLAAESGRGVAYSTDEPVHLLNVPAGKLSADAGDPDQFAHWAGERLGRPVGRGEFLPRYLLGRYLGDLLAAAAGRCRTARLRRVHDTVTGARRGGDGVTLRLASGGTVSASAVVLAVGIAAPDRGWAPGTLRTSPRFVADPWVPGTEFAEDGDLLFVGSGLTMVDLALQLDRPHRTMYAVSRTGLLPRRHLAGATCPRLDVEVSGASGLDAVWRAVSAGRGWRAAVDSLRPVTARVWAELPAAERERFLAEKVRYWNTYRHRMAPAAADRASCGGRAGCGCSPARSPRRGRTATGCVSSCPAGRCCAWPRWSTAPARAWTCAGARTRWWPACSRTDWPSRARTGSVSTPERTDACG